jgi:uncharacterized protein
MAWLHRVGKKVFFGRYQRPWRWPKDVQADTWERVTFISTSGARLSAILGRAEGHSKGAVVLAHPMGVAAKGFWLKHGHAEVLRRGGFDVLAFDFNGFGESDSGTFDYPADVLAAGTYLRERFPDAQIGVLGASFGAGYALCALAAEGQPFCAAVLEAPFPSLPYYWRRFLVPSLALRLSQIVYPRLERDLRPIRAAASIAGKPRVLLIHGDADTITPVGVGRQLQAAIGDRAFVEFWIAPGAEHNLAFSSSPDLYAQQVVTFLERAFISARG